MRGISTALALLLSGTAAQAAQPVIIENDPGGIIPVYISRMQNHEPMEIHGYCASACTVYMANPNVCFDRNAVLLFHAPSFDYVGTDPVITRGMTSLERDAANNYLMPYYTEQVKRWIKERGGLKVTTTDLLELKGEELRQLVSICPTSDTQEVRSTKIDYPQIAANARYFTEPLEAGRRYLPSSLELQQLPQLYLLFN